MGIPILIIGKSGSGKSTSMRHFDPQEVAVINVLKKPLPFRNKLTTYHTDDYAKVKGALLKAPMKTIVIDDAGYLIVNEFMRGHSALGAGNAIFQFYNKLADNFWDLVNFISEKLPNDKIVYIIMHEEKNDFGEVKPKTIGKLLDEKWCVEGSFTIVLRSMYSDGRYVFRTKTDGSDVCKSPPEMFDGEEIDNDLKAVDTAIREYYGLNESEENENE